MLRKFHRAHALAAALGAVALVASPAARAAAPACSNTALFPNPVYVSGASVAKPLVQALAKVIAPLGVSIIYQNPDSCLGLADIVANQASTESGISTLYLAPDGVSTTACTLDSDSPQPVDIAVSEVYASTCPSAIDAGAAGLVEVLGPINAMVFAVPGGTNPSTATSISAEAAYTIFGYDAATYIVQPWNTPGGIFVREETSGSEAMIGVAIGLPAAKWANALTGSASPQQETTSTKMTTALQTSSAPPSATIGVLGSENVYSTNATSPTVPLNILAYQHSTQSCGYYPSTTAKAMDQLNVRQGRYAIWGPLHFFAHVNGAGQLTGPDADAVAAVLDQFIATGETPDAPLYPIGSLGAPADAGADGASPLGTDGGVTVSTAAKQAFIAAEPTPGFVVPWCAMETIRDGEMGPEASYQSPEPCSCFFETTAQGAPVSGHTCTSCSATASCPGTQVCRYGYCEVQ
jgi:hypothetical protein